MFQTPTTRVWKQLYDAGKLRPPQTFFWEAKPPEELYDLETDRYEVQNLADSPAHQAILRELREALRAHLLNTRDAGFLPEPEQHRRATGTSIYELCHDPARYPLEQILAAADLASGLKPHALPQLKSGLADKDSGVRFWSALGLLMRGSNAVHSARQELRLALQDEAPAVRVTAANALAKFAGEPEQSLALDVLQQLMDPEKNTAYVSIMALNALQSLPGLPPPLRESIKRIPLKDPSAPERANSYVPRLVSELTGAKAE
jgi:uncharacterized sulfatase